MDEYNEISSANSKLFKIMRIELFTLCEGAFNTNGRLTIVNTFEDIVSEKFPWRGQLGLALKILFPHEESGGFDILVRIKPAGDAKPLHEIKGHLEIKHNGGGKDVRLAMCTNIQGVALNNPGDYEVVVLVNDNVLQAYPFKALVKHE